MDVGIVWAAGTIRKSQDAGSCPDAERCVPFLDGTLGPAGASPAGQEDEGKSCLVSNPPGWPCAWTGPCVGKGFHAEH